MSFVPVPAAGEDRTRGDLCPGSLRLFEASDGHIGRVRAPGGYLTAAQWEALADMADELGDGDIHLTSRGNIQIRGVTDDCAFANASTEAGLLPVPTHERMRNILASPLSGRHGGLADVRSMVRALDRELTSVPALAGLSGRTLFALDDGHRDVIHEKADFAALATGSEAFDIYVAGRLIAHATRLQVVPSLVALAEAWQDIRGERWRVKEAPEVVGDLARALASKVARIDLVEDSPTVSAESTPAQPNDNSAEVPSINKDNALTNGNATDAPANPQQPPFPQPTGWIDQVDGRVSVAMTTRFGVVPSTVARLIAATEKASTVTCWHGIVLHDLTAAEADAVVRFLAPRGMVFDAASPWQRVTACTGLPGCAKARADVRADAAEGMNSRHFPEDTRVHVVGCERRCGAPNRAFIEYLALGGGEYEVTERPGPRLISQD